MSTYQSLAKTMSLAAFIPVVGPGPSGSVHPALTLTSAVARRRSEAIKVVDDLIRRLIVVVLFDC